MNENENTNNNSEFSNTNNQPVEQLTSLENNEPKNELQVVTQVEQGMLISVQEFVPESMRSYIESDIQRLNERHNSSIAELRKNGALSAELIKKSENLLSSMDINVDSLTPSQALELFDFAKETNDAVRYVKGVRLYKLLKNSLSPEEIKYIYSSKSIDQRRYDQIPESDSYRGADYYSRAVYFKEVATRMNSIEKRFMEEQYRKDDVPQRSSDKKTPRVFEEKDYFSQSIGRIAAVALENKQNENTYTDDDINIGIDRGLRWAMDVSESYNDVDDYSDANELTYRMFTDGDIDFIENEVELRNDVSKYSSNNLHTEKIKEIFSGATVSDFLDQLHVDYIEEMISENRLTAKSVVGLGVSVIEKYLSMKNDNSQNSGKIALLANRTESLCRSLLNIEESQFINGSKVDSCHDLKQRCEKRSQGVWDRVNGAVKNLKTIDYLLQYAQELVILLDMNEDNNNRISLGNGNDIK